MGVLLRLGPRGLSTPGPVVPMGEPAGQRPPTPVLRQLGTQPPGSSPRGKNGTDPGPWDLSQEPGDISFLYLKLLSTPNPGGSSPGWARGGGQGHFLVTGNTAPQSEGEPRGPRHPHPAASAVPVARRPGLGGQPGCHSLSLALGGSSAGLGPCRKPFPSRSWHACCAAPGAGPQGSLPAVCLRCAVCACACGGGGVSVVCVSVMCGVCMCVVWSGCVCVVCGVCGVCVCLCVRCVCVCV